MPTRLSHEDRFIQAVAKLRVSPLEIDHAWDSAADKHFDWASTMDLAARGHVHAVLAHQILATPTLSDLVPTDVHEGLCAARAEALFRHGLYGDALASVLDDLAVAGIPVALMKGAALSVTLYPPGSRRLNDCDLLIERDTYDEVAALLDSRGFKHAPREGHTERDELEAYHEIVFVKGSGVAQVTVDLHWRVYPRGRPFHFENHCVFARAQRGVFGGAPVLVLSPEDLFVHYATQLVNDDLHVTRLRFVDIHGLASSGLQWSTVKTIAADAGATKVTRLAARLAAMLGADVPMDMLGGWSLDATWMLADERWMVSSWRLRDSVREFLSRDFCDRPPDRAAERLPAALAADTTMKYPRPSYKRAGGAAIVHGARLMRALGATRLASRVAEVAWVPVDAPR